MDDTEQQAVVENPLADGATAPTAKQTLYAKLGGSGAVAAGEHTYGLPPNAWRAVPCSAVLEQRVVVPPHHPSPPFLPAAVDIFYRKLLSDPDLAPFFEARAGTFTHREICLHASSSMACKCNGASAIWCSHSIHFSVDETAVQGRRAGVKAS